MKQGCGCSPTDRLLVDGWCYICLKRTAGLIGYTPNGHPLTEEQRDFIGHSGDPVPSASGLEGLYAWEEHTDDPWEALLRGLDTEPVHPWERTTPEHAGYGDPR